MMENDNDGKLWKIKENDNDGKFTAVICSMAASAGSGRARLAHAALRHLALYLSLTNSLLQTRRTLIKSIIRVKSQLIKSKAGLALHTLHSVIFFSSLSLSLSFLVKPTVSDKLEEQKIGLTS